MTLHRLLGNGLLRVGGVAAVPWYRAGGAPAPVAAWQPKGAASYAASKVNLANPGTYNAFEGAAPTWSAANGWTGDGATTFLKTGITPGANWTMAVRVAGVVNDEGKRQTAIGSLKGPYFELRVQHFWTGLWYLYGDGGPQKLPYLGTGTAGMFATAGYRNGASDAAISATWSGTAAPLFLLASTADGATANNWLNGSFLAAVVWDTNTLAATWLPAVMAAMAAL